MRPNVYIEPQRDVDDKPRRSRGARVLALPALVWGLTRAMRGADAIHVRCPGSLGLMGAVLAPLFSQRLVAKYAGQWSGYAGEPWTWRLQRALLRSRWWGGPVTVYGRWPDQPAHVIPFFTSMLTVEQLARARQAAQAKVFGDRLRILFVGRLSAAKNVNVLLEALALLARRSLRVRCAIVGDGPQRPALETQADDLGLKDSVQFSGGVDLERVLDHYEEADVLVLASETEGWPKVVAEAMAFGLVCVASDRGLLPEMLGNGRGLLVPPGDAAALAEALGAVAADPAASRAMAGRAASWAQQFSLDGLREALRDLLNAHWSTPAGTRGEPALRPSKVECRP